jgi:hypothetical protein
MERATGESSKVGGGVLGALDIYSDSNITFVIGWGNVLYR